MITSKSDMLVATAETIADREIAETLGPVRGSTVRAKHLGTGIVAALRNPVGGEVREYANLLAGSREQAPDQMIDQACEFMNWARTRWSPHGSGP